MMQVVFHRFPDVEVEYHFALRRRYIDLSACAQAITEQIQHLCTLTLQTEEIDYLKALPFMKNDFINFLDNFKLNNDFIHIENKEGFSLKIRGPWLHTILFEVPILAIISEVYGRHVDIEPDFALGEKKLRQKLDSIKNDPSADEFRFTDFGTRRRFSQAWQQQVIEMTMAQAEQYFIGSSNIYLAKKFNIAPIGTMAHEYVQAFQAFTENIGDSQRHAFEVWIEEYQGQLGIALSDTLNLKTFIKDFNLSLAQSYRGIRQDSGDPMAWGDRIIQRYRDLGIDPSTKTLVFSDALTFEKSLKIYQHFKQRCKVNFGIGTYLTNDISSQPLDMVIKMVRCNGLPVAKISDDPAKSMCIDADYLAKLQKLL